jgi:hypothetical protein
MRGPWKEHAGPEPCEAGAGQTPELRLATSPHAGHHRQLAHMLGTTDSYYLNLLTRPSSTGPAFYPNPPKTLKNPNPSPAFHWARCRALLTPLGAPAWPG